MNTRTDPAHIKATYDGAIVNGAISHDGMATRNGISIRAENQIAKLADAVRSRDQRGFFLLEIARSFFPAHSAMRDLLDAIHGLNTTGCADADALDPIGHDLVEAALKVASEYGVEVSV
uniref:hypothetical protein n=1 Tax=Yoonia sp. TaxID=2212373 RepID=UPI0040471539